MRRSFVIMLAAALQAGPARAEYPEPIGLEQVQLGRRELDEHVARLELLPSQRDEAALVFAEYDAEMTQALAAWKDAIRWINACAPAAYDAADEAYYQRFYYPDVTALETSWQLEARAMETRYFELLAAIAPDQRREVAAIRRERFRHRVLTRLADLSMHLETPAGADVDVWALIASLIDRPDRDLDRELIAYGRALDPLLEQLDAIDWQFERERRKGYDALRNARRADAQDAARLAQLRCVEIAVRPYELCWAVRRLNVDTAARIVALCDPASREQLRDALQRRLHPFAFPAGEAEISTRIERALSSPDVPDRKRAGLQAARDELRAGRERDVPAVAAAYDAARSAERCRIGYASWLQNALDRQHDPPDPNAGREQVLAAAIAARQAAIERLRERVERLLAEDAS